MYEREGGGGGFVEVQDVFKPRYLLHKTIRVCFVCACMARRRGKPFSIIPCKSCGGFFLADLFT